MLCVKRLVLLFLALSALSSKSFADDSLRVAFTQWPPYQIYHAESGISGIVYDALKEIEKRMEIKLHITRLPQKRMLTYFKNGEIDIEPAANQKWRSAYNHLSLYSIPYFQVQHVIYMKDTTEISGDHFTDFKDKTIGTRLGFNYDLSIGKAFTHKLIKRKDSRQHDKNLILLKAGRIDGIVIDRQELNYWINELGYDFTRYKEAYEVGPAIDVCMRLHKSQAHLLPKLNQTLKEMLEEGFIDRAIIKYTRNHEGKTITANINYE